MIRYFLKHKMTSPLDEKLLCATTYHISTGNGYKHVNWFQRVMKAIGNRNKAKDRLYNAKKGHRTCEDKKDKRRLSHGMQFDPFCTEPLSLMELAFVLYSGTRACLHVSPGYINKPSSYFTSPQLEPRTDPRNRSSFRNLSRRAISQQTLKIKASAPPGNPL